MQVTKTNTGHVIIAALIIYAIALAYQGYLYGKSDQSQILPVLLEQDKPGSYQKDHYVNAYLQSGINERTIFHFLLRHAGYQYPWIVFMWHALFSVALITAWIKVSQQFIKSRLIQFGVIAMILTVGYHFATGSNEIYYPSLVPSLCAKALASWAIYAWIKEKLWTWIILLLLSTIFQPLVGLQVFIITAAGSVLHLWQQKKLRDYPLLHVVSFIIATSPWITLLTIHNGGHTDPGRFLSILEFRLSHHFFGSYFHPLQLFIVTLLTVFVIFFYKGKLKWMFIVCAIGIVFYEIGAEVLQLPAILYSQWWKTTIWIEAFAILALGALLERKVKFISAIRFDPNILLVFLLGLTIFYRTILRPDNTEYMFPFLPLQSEEVEISIKAKEHSPVDALFLIPPELTAFRWFAQRSSYVDYKAMLHTEKFLFDWYHRLDAAYGYNAAVKNNGLTIYQHTRTYLNDPGDDLISKWKAIGITHLITHRDAMPKVTPIASNGSYSIYQLP